MNYNKCYNDESENQGMKMNKSKIKVMMENDTPVHVNNLRSRTVKATYIWDRDTSPETKTKTLRFKEESRPDGQHSPSTATSSRVTLNWDMLEETNLQLMYTSGHDIRRGNMGSRHPSKEQASGRTNNDG